MIAVVERVKKASLTADGVFTSSIENGLLVFVGVYENDTKREAEILASKIAALRIFEDEKGKMNLSVKDILGEVLAVSNFTLCADTKKGNRPSFVKAQKPDTAKELYEYFCEVLNKEIPVKTGVFGADMQIENCCDGPVTIILNTDIWNKK